MVFVLLAMQMREQLVLRAVLTAVAEVKLVRRPTVEIDRWGRRRTITLVDDDDVGSAVSVSECEVTLDEAAGSCPRARVALVLQRRDDLDYVVIAGCITTRVSELDCLSGRRSSGACVDAAIKVLLQDAQDRASRAAVATAVAVDAEILDQALGRSATDRAFGLRDLRLASLETRLGFLLQLGLEERPWLDETVRGCCGEIEELGVMGLDEPCCATGCEPCVWEAYYRQQAKKRRQQRLQTEAPRERKRPRETEACNGLDPRAGPAEPPPCLTPDRLQPMCLLAREQHTSDTILLAFGATLACEPPSPWHVRLRLPSIDGEPVTR